MGAGRHPAPSARTDGAGGRDRRADPILRTGLLMSPHDRPLLAGDTHRHDASSGHRRRAELQLAARLAVDDRPAQPRSAASTWRSSATSVGARAFQHSFALRMVEMGDPIRTAVGWYLGASLGDMAWCDDIIADIVRARELADGYGDVSLLGQLLLVEARALRRAGDGRVGSCSTRQPSGSSAAGASGPPPSPVGTWASSSSTRGSSWRHSAIWARRSRRSSGSNSVGLGPGARGPRHGGRRAGPSAGGRAASWRPQAGNLCDHRELIGRGRPSDR